MSKEKLKICIEFFENINSVNRETIEEVQDSDCMYEGDDSPANIKSRQLEIDSIDYGIKLLKGFLE